MPISGATLRNFAFSILTNVATAVAFGSAILDDGGFFNPITDNTKLVVPTGGDGWYIVSCSVRWPAPSAGPRVIQILVNGISDLNSPYSYRLPNTNVTDPAHTVTVARYLVAGDYVQLYGYQAAGGTVTADFTLSMARAGALGCTVNSASITVNFETATTFTYPSAVRDDGGFFSGGSHLTVPTGGDGWYTISAFALWHSNVDNLRILEIQVNGTAISWDYYNSSGLAPNPGTTAAITWYLAAGDYVTLVLSHNAHELDGFTPSNLPVTVALSLARVQGTLGASMENTSMSIPSDRGNPVPHAITKATFSSTIRDDGGFFNLSNDTQFKVPLGDGGLYAITVSCKWVDTGDAQLRFIAVGINGGFINLSTFPHTQLGWGQSFPVDDTGPFCHNTGQNASVVWCLKAGDIVEMGINHTSITDPLLADCRLSLARINSTVCPGSQGSLYIAKGGTHISSSAGGSGALYH